MLAGDATLFTFSIHAARNYPFEKEASDLDIELPDGTGDAEYLSALERGVCTALSVAQPDLAIYLAGADPIKTIGWSFEPDQSRVGRAGPMVLDLCRTSCIPVAITRPAATPATSKTRSTSTSQPFIPQLPG
jgi:acetoin utilization deacetylase AcuC-like enzyme